MNKNENMLKKRVRHPAQHKLVWSAD